VRLVEARGCVVRLGRRLAVDGADIAVDAGEVVGLLGPNGAGKSTLMRALLGLVPAAGALALGDARGPRAIAARRALLAAWLPQAREAAWPITVAALVMLGRRPHRRPGRAPSAADHAAVAAALTRMDLDGLRDRPADALSGGELARALIARALAQETPLIVADEPTAGLDPAHQLALMAAFRALAAEGRGVLVSLHDLALAARWCDRLVLMAAGRVVADGPPRAVLTPPALAAVYGVRAHVAEGPEGLIVQPLGLAGAAAMA